MNRDQWQGHPLDSLSAYLDGEVAPMERDDIAAHLAACASCRGLLEDMRRLDAALVEDEPPPVPARLAQRIRAGVEAAEDTAGAPPHPATRRGTPPRRPAWRWLSPLPLGAVTGLLIVSAVAWLVWRAGTPMPMAPSTRPADVMAPPPATLEVQAPAPETVQPGAGRMAPERPGATGAMTDARRLSGPPRRTVGSSGTKQTAQPEDKVAAAAPPPAGTAHPDTSSRSGLFGRADMSAAAKTLNEPAAAAPESWPVAIDAAPYRVVLTADDAMTVTTGSWTCAIAIDPEDGRRLASLARPGGGVVLVAHGVAVEDQAPPQAAGAAAQEEKSRERSGAPAAAPASAGAAGLTAGSGGSAHGLASGAPAATAPATEKDLTAAQAALRLVRGRYRPRIEERCGPLPR